MEVNRSYFIVSQIWFLKLQQDCSHPFFKFSAMVHMNNWSVYMIDIFTHEEAG